MFVADTNNHRIRRIDSTGRVETFIGTSQGNVDGDRLTAKLKDAIDVVVESPTSLIVAEGPVRSRVRRVKFAGLGELRVAWESSFSSGEKLRFKRYVVTATRAGSGATATCTSEATGCVLTGLRSGETYAVSVQAEATSGRSSAKAATTAKTN